MKKGNWQDYKFLSDQVLLLDKNTRSNLERFVHFQHWLNEVEQQVLSGLVPELPNSFRLNEDGFQCAYSKPITSFDQLQKASYAIEAQHNFLPWELQCNHFDRLSAYYSIGIITAQLFAGFNPEDETQLIAFTIESRILQEHFPSVDARLLKEIEKLTKLERAHRPKSLSGLISVIGLLIQEKQEGQYASEAHDKYRYTLAAMQNRLLNFSKQNPLLHLSKRVDIELASLSEGQLEIEELQNEESFKKLDKLRIQAQREQRETGNEVLKLAIGLLSWQHNDKQFDSPIVFLDAEINKTKSLQPTLLLSVDFESAIVNPALRHYFKQKFDLLFPKTLLFETPDEIDFEWLQNGLEKLQISFAQGSNDITANHWFISKTACLSNFSQHDGIIISDYDELLLLPEHELAAKLLDGNRDEDVETAKDFSEFDSIYNVLPADPTQQLAIQSAILGNSSCIEGPPGTGKSQTIVNLISNFLYQNKKVLFVSEKRAALDVVWNKLEALNLHNISLLVHNQRKERKEILVRLQSAFEYLDEPVAFDMDSHRRISTHNLNRANSRLKELHQARNEKHISGLNFNDFVQLHRNEFLVENELPLSHLIPWYSEVYRDEKSLNKLGDLLIKFGFEAHWNANPFAQVETRYLLLQNSPDKYLQSQIVLLSGKLNLLVAEILKLDFWNDGFNNLGNLEKAINWCKGVKNYANRGWIKLLDNQSSLFELFEKLRADYFRKKKTLERRQERLLTESELPPIHQVESALKLLQIGGRRNKRKVKSFLNEHFNLDHEAFGDDYETLLKHLLEESQAAENLETVVQKFKTKFGVDAPESFFEDFELVNDLTERTILQIPGFFEGLFSKRFSDKVLLSILSISENATDIFGAARLVDASYRSQTPDELLATAQSLSQIGNLESLVEVLKVFNGLGYQVQQALRDNKLSPTQLVAASIQKEIAEIKNRNPIIDQIGLGAESELQNEISELYAEWLESNAMLIKDNAKKRFQQGESLIHTSANHLTESEKLLKWQLRKGKKILQHEFSKKKQLKTLNALFEEDSKHYITHNIGVWLMSPASVSSIFKAELNAFDVVIFDEASQVKIEAALPSIIRAKQSIIIGDSNQLPPSNFFKRNLGDERLSDLLNESESILQLASGSLQKIQMQWHYRSSQAELMAFNNAFVYGGKLNVFPTAGEKSNSIEVYYNSKSSYKAGKNRAEAELLIEQFRKLLVEKKQFSIAIISLSKGQQEQIEEVIEDLAERDMAFKAVLDQASQCYSNKMFDGPIIKNLENIQGEERDITLISTSYGMDENGQFIQNFGPIIHSGGDKRLNVVFSRARKKIMLFTSLRPDMITNDINEGALFLKLYLQYAAAVSVNRDKDAKSVLRKVSYRSKNQVETSSSSFENDVRLALLEIGLEIEVLSELGQYQLDHFYSVKKKGQILDVLVQVENQDSDFSASWFMAQNVLGKRGFRVYAISYSDFYTSKRELLIKLKNFIKA